jgi:hypothetical protein
VNIAGLMSAKRETQARLGFQSVPISVGGGEHAERRGVRRLIRCNRRIPAPAKTIRREVSDKFISIKIKFRILTYEFRANVPAERRRRGIGPRSSQSRVRECSDGQRASAGSPAFDARRVA